MEKREIKLKEKERIKKKKIVEVNSDIKTLLCKLFMEHHNQDKDINKVKQLIKNKQNSYKQQDILKNRNINDFITEEEITEKIIASHNKCYYCRKNIKVLYSDVRDPLQWTLDRKDNTLCHSYKNCVISCLECNLQKRRRETDKFQFSKQLKIIKKEEN